MRNADLAGAVTLSLMLVACGVTNAPSGTAASLTAAQSAGVVAVVNDCLVGLATLDDDMALDARAARNIVAHRDGADGQCGTADDNPFDDLAELDAVSFVGTAALNNILAWAVANGYVSGSGSGGQIGTFDGVSFTQAEAEGVLAIANGATLTTLDDDVGLDGRAATGILAARPFADPEIVANMQRLAAVPYVGASALNQLKAYISSWQPGGCTPTTCAAAGASCGSIPDGCGGTLDCGTCSSGSGCTIEGVAFTEAEKTCAISFISTMTCASCNVVFDSRICEDAINDASQCQVGTTCTGCADDDTRSDGVSCAEIAGYSYFGSVAAQALLDHVRANPCGGSGGGGAAADHVILISVDGLASWLLGDMVDGGGLPNFRRLQNEGAWTHNARTDYSHTNTIPNHTSMITGRPVTAVPGMPADTHHGYTVNIDPGAADTLHNMGNPSLAYVPSAFDVAHDSGLRTCLFASKSKFVIFEQSYDADSGAPDTTGVDDGRNKIDLAEIEADTPTLTADFVTAMQANPCNFTFLHFRDPDSAGHSTGWGSPEWVQAVQNVDALLGSVLALVDSDPSLRGRTTIILTADHGGSSTGHSTATNSKSYTIPFYVRGPGIPAGADLHLFASGARQDPGTARTSYLDAVQPIRNGDSGNLALGILGLGQIPGSFIRDMGIVP